MSGIPNWFVYGITDARVANSDDKFRQMGDALAHHALGCLQDVEQDAEAAEHELVLIWRDHRDADGDMRTAVESWMGRWMNPYMQLVPGPFRQVFVDGFMSLMADEPALV